MDGNNAVTESRPSVNEAGARDAVPRIGFTAALLGVVDRPRATLEGIYQSHRMLWLWPMILVAFSILVLNLVSAPHAAELAREEVRRQLQMMPEEQAALVSSQIETIGSPLFVGASGAITGLLGMVLAILIAAAVLYFASLISGAEIEFSPFFSVIAWTWIPFFLRNLVEAGYILVRKELIVNQGLSWLVSVGEPMKDAGNLSYFLLSYVQVFVIWHLFLVWAGLRGATRVSGLKAAVLVLIYAFISLVLNWIPLRIGMALSGAGV